MKHLKRFVPVPMLIAMFISLLLTAGVASVASAASPTSRTGGSWGTVPGSTANTGTKSDIPNNVTNRLMTGVSVVSASDIWAVGYSFTSNVPPQTLTEHWNGTSWSIVSSPNVGTGDNFLTSVSVVSASDIWAVGDYISSNGFYHMLIEHWDGTSWSVVTSPTIGLGQHLQSVTVLSTNNVWAVGYYYNGSVFQTLIVHWNGTSWSVVSSPNVGTGNNYLNGVVKVSATNIWAAGEYTSGFEMPGSTLTEHWNGSSWSVVSSPNVGTGGSILGGVAAVSASSVWAVGEYTNSNSVSQTLIEHWNGSSWSVVSSPNVGTGSNTLNGVAVVSKSSIWAVGSYIDSNGFGRTLVEHWNGTKWKVVSSPNVGTNSNELYGVAVVSASNVWAVGNYLNATPNYLALIEHWNGTKWSLVTSPT